MKFSLKDYQEDAVKDVLTNLRKASKRWHEDGDRHAFSLTATTGAGKTVMAAAVLEALFYGDDNFDFEPDPSAVVIWFSDDPALNAQSRFRLLEASDRLSISDLEIVKNSFNRETLEAGKVYFLNTQKLSKNSRLVRGYDPDDSDIDVNSGQIIMPDGRAFTAWDTIKNTIENPELTLYLVLDEAHRGMKPTSGEEKATIVKRMINGSGAIPGIPIVLGISATVDRFNEAMAGMQDRGTLPNVVVDSGKVQASGLLKDTIVLDVPDETGQYDTVLVRRGTDKLKESSAAWEAYAEEQGEADLVQPLMVLQVPNSPDHDEIGRALDTIYDRWPELSDDAVSHVFGDHTTQIFGSHSITYVPPERVQESNQIRVLIAKDAISTGWDCPRAEVMVSFRPARDRTHITQLVGRMVRTPLARRVPGNERLNAVYCLLPFFDPKSVQDVAAALMQGTDGGGELPGRRVLINAEEMKRNRAIPQPVWDKLLSLPSQSLPKRQAKPVKRLTLLAHELAADGLLPEAGKKAHAEMHKALNAARARYKPEIAKARASVLSVEGKTLKADLKSLEMSFDEFLEDADFAVIDDAYNRAARVISPDLATTYCESIAEAEGQGDDLEAALIEARMTVAALGLVPQVKEFLEAEAEKLANEWLTEYRVDIKSLSDERQDIYRQIGEMSAHPLDVDLAMPGSWMQPTTVREVDGTETPLPRFDRHLLCGEDGMFPEHFNSWESEVLAAELQRKDTIAWYRNPSRASQDSLGVTYEEGGNFKILRPDFIFFTQGADGSIAADIVDPHGAHFADSIPKLRGLAAYAASYGKKFRRIDAVAKIGENFRVLDLQEEHVREAIADANSVTALYESAVGGDYTK